MELHKALRIIIANYGINILNNIKVINILKDYTAFDNSHAAENVLSFMIESHKMDEYINVSPEDIIILKNKIVYFLSNNVGFDYNLCEYVIDSVAWALGFINDDDINNLQKFNEDENLSDENKYIKEAFDILKDDWANNKETLIKCIVETQKWNGDLSMKMWEYLIQNNLYSCKSINFNKEFIDDVVSAFCKKKSFNFDVIFPYELCGLMFSYMMPYLVNNSNLVNIIFGKLHNAGYSGEYLYGDEDLEVIPALLTCFIIDGQLELAKLALNPLMNNPNLNDICFGELLLKTEKYIDDMLNNKNYFKGLVGLKDKVKKYLLSCVNKIRDKQLRAKIVISVILK